MAKKAISKKDEQFPFDRKKEVSMYKKQQTSVNAAALGIELGTTRIKAVLTDEAFGILASNEYSWENRFIDNLWTYSMDDVWAGLRACYAGLKKDFKQKYGVTLQTVGAIGVSAMMHGYLVFDKAGKQLAPFRTWRNNNAAAAAKELTKLFNYPIPDRWSIAHLYQAILNGEPHVKDIDYITALEGYVHWRLTGEKAIGVGEASGMFPVDVKTKLYDERRAKLFETAAKKLGFNRKVNDIFPCVLPAGVRAGNLTAEGARLLDPEGDLKAGIPFCPPEGDADTGMVATNCIKPGTGSVSAGTSIFGLIVLRGEPTGVYPEIDLLLTPAGDMAAMAHGVNCTSEINAWVGIFDEFCALTGMKTDKNELYDKLFNAALAGDPACGGLIAYNYLSGEHITHIEKGRPLFVRTTESEFNLANFMRAQLYSAFATLRIGFEILQDKENVKIDSLIGHGGIFKTKGIAQRFLAAALKTPVTVSETANEGGPWGTAILARYMLDGGNLPLNEYLDTKVFASVQKTTIAPDPLDAAGFDKFMEGYVKGLAVVREAVNAI